MKRRSTTYHITEVYYKGKFKMAEHEMAKLRKEKPSSIIQTLTFVAVFIGLGFFAYGLANAKPHQYAPTVQHNQVNTEY